MDADTRVKLAIYHHFAETGKAPDAAEVARRLAMPVVDVFISLGSLRQNRVLWLEPDGRTIRMAPPFAAAPTQHKVLVAGKEYYGNCAWDALGIPAALKGLGVVFSRCEQSGEPLVMEVELDKPPASDWLFHSVVPAAAWWNDLPFT